MACGCWRETCSTRICASSPGNAPATSTTTAPTRPKPAPVGVRPSISTRWTSPGRMRASAYAPQTHKPTGAPSCGHGWYVAVRRLGRATRTVATMLKGIPTTDDGRYDMSDSPSAARTPSERPSTQAATAEAATVSVDVSGGSAAARRRAARRQRSRPEIRNAPRDPQARVGELLGGTYRIERLIAIGGMGSVYEVSHTRLEQHFAVKFLDPSFLRDAEAYARFRREAEIASRLNHENVVQVFDFNTDAGGGVYMVMELVEGQNLDQLLETEQLSERDDVLGIFEPLCDALEACHEHGIVHRDLKPSNIMVRHEGPRARVKLLDFGISKIKEEQAGPHTRDNVVMGTPNYMSPEQARGQNTQLDARTDIFALGAILYEMLSGFKAFDEPGLPQLLHQIIYEEPESLATLAPKTPERVVKVVERCLRKDAEQRYADVSDLFEELALAYRVTPRKKPERGPGLRLPRLWLAAWPVSLAVVGALTHAMASTNRDEVQTAEPAPELVAPVIRPPAPTETERPSFSAKLAVPGAHLLSADGQLYRADWAGLALWADPGAESKTRVLPSHAPVSVLTLSNDGRQVLVGQADGTVSRWDRSLSERLDVSQFGRAPIAGLAGGSGYLVVADGKAVRLIHESTGKQLKRFRSERPTAVLLTQGANPKVLVVRSDELEVLDADSRSAVTTFPLEARAIRAGYIEQTTQGFAKLWIDSDQGEWRVRRTYLVAQVSSKRPLTLELVGQQRLDR
ncbi:MAG: serine/threonine protein kinase [Myxococcales bacterium FL481]|nr:MAG: serine/threonine protein kinase [Myxococcales bacterium FL481]